MRKVVSQYYRGTIGAVTAAAGTLYSDESTGNLYLHDGVTVGGNKIGGALPTRSTTDAITASATSIQGGYPLSTVVNRITTVATSGDCVTLPAAAAGLMIVVTNAHASTSADVFPASGDVINALSANAAYALAATKTAIFFAANSTNWNTVLTA